MWEGKKTLPADIFINERINRHTKLKIVLEEGRNRQIRKIAEYFGHPVKTLHRQAIGSLQISNLPLGKYRSLTREEVDRLTKQSSVKGKEQDSKNSKFYNSYKSSKGNKRSKKKIKY